MPRAELNSAHRIDHLVYACANRDRGIREIRDRLGADPVIGGQHPMYGTHNALLSLGPQTYLEIVARDPELPVPGRGAWIDLADDEESRLLTWVVRAEDIDSASAAARSAGIEIGPLQEGSRRTPDGSVISWRLTDPYALPLDGSIPFLISWGETKHPALTSPSGGSLIGMALVHPHPDRVRTALDVLAVPIDVAAGDSARLIATIETWDGVVELS